LIKHLLGYILGDCFANSSVHPARALKTEALRPSRTRGVEARPVMLLHISTYDSILVVYNIVRADPFLFQKYFRGLRKSSFFSFQLQAQSRHNKLLTLRDSIYDFPTSVNPAGIRSRVICSSGGCGDCVTPPEPVFVFLFNVFLCNLGHNEAPAGFCLSLVLEKNCLFSTIRGSNPARVLRYLGLYTLQCCCQNLICTVNVCIRENKLF
jgi:hypothetical protein